MAINDAENSLYGTHLPVLRLACEHVAGPVIEFGAGRHSTSYLATLAAAGRRCDSYEDSPDWADAMRDCAAAGVSLHLVPNLVDTAFHLTDHYGVCFVDSSPHTRRFIIEAMQSRADVIVVHDTEDEAEWLYQMRSVLDTFTFRRDWADRNRTTVVSNIIDPEEW
jgi:hypothetical protein